MLTRRTFTALAGAAAAGTIAAPRIGRGASLPTVRLGNASGLIDAQLIFQTVGESKRLNFYEQEGCAVEVVNMSGVGQTLQSVAAGNADTSAVSPVAFLSVYAKNPTIDLMFPYCWLRQAHWSIAVKPDSPLKELRELKGQNIGIRNQGDTGYIGARAMFKEIGIDPDKDVDWVPIGEGGPAGEAIYRGRVAAMAFWDGAFARIENAGFKLRHLPNTPGMQHLFGNAYCQRKSTFAANRKLYTGFFRAMAKSTLFAFTNPELSIRLHWEVYPESKPKGKTDAEAMQEALHVVNSRKDKWMPPPWDNDKRFGAMKKEDWDAQVKFAGLEAQIKDTSPIFTNEILDEVNNFDRDKIIKMATEMKI
jgi:NitT/TauT family transport system substrate-binding protein